MLRTCLSFIRKARWGHTVSTETPLHCSLSALIRRQPSQRYMTLPPVFISETCLILGLNGLQQRNKGEVNRAGNHRITRHLVGSPCLSLLGVFHQTRWSANMLELIQLIYGHHF